MKDLYVLKFGGKTISDINKINKIANLISSFINKGNRAVVVVSAIGGETDSLIELAASLEGCGYHRELDHLISTGEIKAASLMSMALLNSKIKSKSLNYTKIGIYTDENHFNSKILKIDTTVVKDLLDQGYVPVVPGFQGINSQKDVCTLGRGGSDITAIALASSLEAKECVLFKDVGGIYNNDPKINKNVKLYSSISYDNLINLLNNGSKIVNIEAAKYAMKNKIKICISCPNSFKIGTRIPGE